MESSSASFYKHIILIQSSSAVIQELISLHQVYKHEILPYKLQKLLSAWNMTAI